MSGGTLQADFGAAGYITGLRQQARGSQSLAVPLVIGQSGTAVTLTGTLALTTLASVMIPGGIMGPNGSLLIEATWSRIASAQAINTYAGHASLVAAFGASGPLVMRAHVHIANRGEAAQVCASAALNPNTAGSAPLISLALNTAVDQTIALQAQLANVGDSLNLELWRVTVCPGF